MNFSKIVAQALAPKGGAPAIRVRAMEDGEAEIVVYDAIGYWGIDSETFRNELSAIDANVIHLRIDCPGGDVFMARAMKTALEQHSAKVIAHVDGLAASAASYLMLAADEIEIAQGANVMIHNAWSMTIGDTREHTSAADLLAKIDGNIRADYARKTGESADHFIDLMNEDTWFDADEALAIGLVDRIYEKDGGVENRFDLGIFDNVPARLNAPEPKPDPELDAAQDRLASNARRLEFYERT